MPLFLPYDNTVNATDLVYGLNADVLSFTAAHSMTRFNKAASFIRTEAKLTTLARVRPEIGADTVGRQRNVDAIRYLQGHSKYSSAVASDDESQGTRRKCKGILSFQLLHQQMRVHFLLGDGVIFQTELAARKLAFGGGGTAEADKEHDITHAEIRWVYRNRGDRRVQAGLQFWRQGAVCGPPWETGSPAEVAAWGEYGNQLDLKHSGFGNISL